MKKLMTNGEVFTIAQILFGGAESEGLANKRHLKTRMAVRQALKFNYIAIQNANKVIGDMIKDITDELMDEFVEHGKATKDDEGFRVKEEFIPEFQIAQQNKLNELSAQKVEVDLYTYPEAEFEAYGTQNDGMLTDEELDVLELFVEKPEETEE